MARTGLWLGAASAAAVALLGADLQASIPPYQLVGSFSLPGGAWDIGPDGRLLAIVGDTIVRQAAVNTGEYTAVGSVPAGTVDPFGASFLRVGGSGTEIAIGDNRFGAGASVAFIHSADLSTNAASPVRSVAVGNFDGTWDGDQFYVSGADSNFVPFVSRVSFAGAAATPAATRVITGIGGGSGGVAIRNGRLFTGAGYSGSGFSTGDVRSFDLVAINSAGQATAFGAGSPIAGGPVLSASPLGFDGLGNLLAGGGDLFSGTSEAGYAAVVDPQTGERLRLSPAGTQGVLYSIAFNAASNELLVSDGATAYRYAVPAPGTLAVLSATGFLAMRRRRANR